MTEFQLLSLLARIIVGVVMLTSGTLKLRAGLAWFKQILSVYSHLPSFMLEIVARVLPTAEVILGIMLIFGLFTWPMVLLTFMLLLIFSLVTLNALLSGKEHDCGCFGNQPQTHLGGRTIAYRNTVLMGILLLPLFGESFATLDNYLFALPLTTPKPIIVATLITYGAWLSFISWFIHTQPLSKASYAQKEVFDGS